LLLLRVAAVGIVRLRRLATLEGPQIASHGQLAGICYTLLEGVTGMAINKVSWERYMLAGYWLITITSIVAQISWLAAVALLPPSLGYGCHAGIATTLA